jgi:hypothetical protein
LPRRWGVEHRAELEAMVFPYKPGADTRFGDPPQ